MKNRLCLLCVAIVCTMLCDAARAQDDASPFLGRWALHLPGGAGWLEVQNDQGFLDASLLWYGGSVLPVSSVHVADGALHVTRNYNVTRMGERTHTISNRLDLHRDGEGLSGMGVFPSRDGIGQQVVMFTGESIPPLPPTPDMSSIAYGAPIPLLNGIDLEGWSLVNPERENGFMVEDGVLINNPVQPEDGSHINYGNLRTNETFEDFRLTLEVNVPEGSNSGVYLRGIYEIQVADTYGRELDSHHMGGLYSRVTPTSSAEKPAGEWQHMDITLYRRHVTVVLNDVRIIDNQPALGVTGGALTADQFAPGPIYLQGDHGRVLYRNMMLTPITN